MRIIFQSKPLGKDGLTITKDDPIFFCIEASQEEVSLITEYYKEFIPPIEFTRATSSYYHWLKFNSKDQTLLFKLKFAGADSQ